MTRAIGWDSIPIEIPITASLQLCRDNTQKAEDPSQRLPETARDQLAGGVDLKRLSFSFCALMNSR